MISVPKAPSLNIAATMTRLFQSTVCRWNFKKVTQEVFKQTELENLSTLELIRLISAPGLEIQD